MPCLKKTGMALLWTVLGSLWVFPASSQAAPGLYTIRGKITVKDTSGSPVDDASGVVIYLDDVKGWSAAPPHDPHPSIASRDKAFVPEVLPVLKGTSVDFPNDDPILHNVFSLSKIQTFDLGLYKKGKKKSVTFTKSGICKVYCNIHEKMSAYVVVLDNPFFALTAKDGSFEIPDVPKGKYSISLWQRYGDGVSKTVAVGEGGAAGQVDFKIIKGEELDFELTQGMKVEKHKNKWGQDYDDKY